MVKRAGSRLVCVIGLATLHQYHTEPASRLDVYCERGPLLMFHCPEVVSVCVIDGTLPNVFVRRWVVDGIFLI